MGHPIYRSAYFVVSVLTCGIASVALSQERPFSEYFQPARDFVSFKTNFDTLTFANGFSSVVGYGPSSNNIGAGYAGNGLVSNTWAPNGFLTDGTVGFEIVNPLTPEGRLAQFFDIRAMVKAATGAPSKYRVDLVYKFFNGDGISLLTSPGTASNGGIVDLTTAGVWTKFNCHRTHDLNLLGLPVRPSAIRIVAIQDSNNNYVGLGGAYNQSAQVTLDNVRVTVPRKLNGLYSLNRTPGELNSILFNNSGTALLSQSYLKTYPSTVNMLDVFGPTDMTGSGAKNSSGVLFSYMTAGKPEREFAMNRFNTALTGLTTDNSILLQPTQNWYLGSGFNGNPVTDRFYGYQGDYTNSLNSFLLHKVTGSQYDYYLRTFGSTSYETTLDLNHEQLVGVADINGDGCDDFVTRAPSGAEFKARLLTGYTGPTNARTAVLSNPVTHAGYGNLTCALTADLDNDGLDDLVMQDPESGDVFALLSTPTGSMLRWLFTLNSNEKILAAEDADNDGCADIFCKRDVSSTVGNVTIRKMASDGQGVLTYNLVVQYANATYAPIALGDINGDGSCDVVFGGNDAPFYSVYVALVNPANRNVLSQSWICSAGTAKLKPIYYHGIN